MIKHLFDRQAVVAELRQGPLKPIRAKKILLFFITFSTLVRLIALLPQAMGRKDVPLMEQLMPLVGGLLIVGIFYLVTVAMVDRLYEANGGDSGEAFYERLFVLLVHSSLRLMVPLVPLLILGFVLIFWIMARPEFIEFAMPTLFGFLAVLVIFPVVYLYTRVKSGLREVSGGA